MADMLRAGAAWLAASLKDAASSPAIYQRGSQTAQIRAVVGRSTFESQDQNGVVESWESRDYIVKVADMPFGVPRRGDRIIESMNGSQHVFEVTSPRGVPLFHYADAFQNSVRIHTKKVD